MWQKVGEMEPLIFRPEIWYSLWYAKNSDASVRFKNTYIFEKITKNRRQPVKPKNHRNEGEFHVQIIELA